VVHAGYTSSRNPPSTTGLPPIAEIFINGRAQPVSANKRRSPNLLLTDAVDPSWLLLGSTSDDDILMQPVVDQREMTTALITGSRRPSRRAFLRSGRRGARWPGHGRRYAASRWLWRMLGLASDKATHNRAVIKSRLVERATGRARRAVGAVVSPQRGLFNANSDELFGCVGAQTFAIHFRESAGR